MREFVLAGEQLRVRFLAAGDRYAHVISLGSEERSWTLLESVEGTADEAWPPSPALQGYNVEHLPADRRVALVVGMAGRSHWSLAAEVTAENGTERLVLDVACRVAALPDHLGNRYRLGPAVRWDAARLVLQTPLGSARLGTRGNDAEAEVRPVGSVNEIEIVPRRREQPPPATIRWKFEIEALGTLAARSIRAWRGTGLR